MHVQPVPFGRVAALERIEILDPNKPFEFEADVPKWKKKIEAKSPEYKDYEKARARELTALICSGDEGAAYIVRGLLKGHADLPPSLVETIVQPNAAKDCPVSAALTEQERVDLRKQAKEASGVH
jgi:hypothetical protein